MLSKVRDWMMDVVVFVQPDTLVKDALATMRRRYIHSIIVDKSPEHPEYGIVTSLDICDKIVAQGQNPAKLKICEIMHTPLITVTRETELRECARLMKDNHIHHLPVVDDNGKPIGMISATDFMVVAEGMAVNFADRSLT
jgi:signal-transduction protein with cAMP-binding, CBS, and nucleotidyltransferase domain